MGPIAIETEGLTRQFSGRTAVDNLNLIIPAGKVFGFLGPNGAGKTTTVRMLTTLIAPTSGTAQVAGHRLGENDEALRRAVGILTETPGLYDRLSARQNLTFFAQLYDLDGRTAARQTERYLRMLELWERRDDPVGGFSRGMRQKLAIARALLHEPEIIFLDEPTVGLDPQSRIALWEILGELQDEGQTVLVTTHRMEEADEHCDRLAIMDRGRILAVDTPQQLKASLGAGAAVTVIAEGDLEALALHLRQGPMATDVRVVEGSVRFSLPRAEGAMQWVLAAAQSGGFRLTDLSVSGDTLEKVFVTLTGEDLRD